MGILTRNAPAMALAALVALATPSMIQRAVGAPSKAAGKAETSAATKTSYENGVKAYQAGRYQNAVDQLSTALRGGGLSSAAMARGLYYRGLAYKQLNKPGLAISDLTSALWLKNGLSDEERKAATAERAEAYKAAGLGDGNSGKDRVAASDPKSETPAPAQAQAAPEPAAAALGAATATQYASTHTADTGGVPQPLTMGAETAVPPPPARKGEGAIDQSAALQQTGPATAATESAVTTAQADAGQANGGQAAPPSQTDGFSGFFSNLFSGGSNASAAPAEAPTGVTTASTSQANPQTSSWSDTTSLTQGGAKPSSKKTSGKTAAAAPEKAAQSKGGKYKLHIAALRSRAAAEALAQKLMQEHAGDFHDRKPAVDEAVIGSMGTFYRVRVGSYKTADEPRGLCNTLRNSGYDCLVVSN